MKVSADVIALASKQTRQADEAKQTPGEIVVIFFDGHGRSRRSVARYLGGGGM